MPLPSRERNPKILWGLILAAITVEIAYRIWPLLTGSPEVDGLLAVFLGFYRHKVFGWNELASPSYES